jgi:hypothetical protein
MAVFNRRYYPYFTSKGAGFVGGLAEGLLSTLQQRNAIITQQNQARFEARLEEEARAREAAERQKLDQQALQFDATMKEIADMQRSPQNYLPHQFVEAGEVLKQLGAPNILPDPLTVALQQGRQRETGDRRAQLEERRLDLLGRELDIRERGQKASETTTTENTLTFTPAQFHKAVVGDYENAVANHPKLLSDPDAVLSEDEKDALWRTTVQNTTARLEGLGVDMSKFLAGQEKSTREFLLRKYRSGGTRTNKSGRGSTPTLTGQGLFDSLGLE